MLHTWLVSDIMTPDLLTVGMNHPIPHAATLLANMQVGGLAVVDDKGQTVGVISTTDLVDYARQSRVVGTLFGQDAQPMPTVADIMSPPVATIRETERVSTAARLMTHDGMHRLLVTNERGDITGIVTATDIARLVGDVGLAGEMLRPYDGRVAA